VWGNSVRYHSLLQTLLAYMDDILIYAKTLEEHDQLVHLRAADRRPDSV